MTATASAAAHDVMPDPRPGDVVPIPTATLRDLDPALVPARPAAPNPAGPAGESTDLFAILDELVALGASPRLAPARAGASIPAPTAAQLRLARAALRAVADPAALVAHVAAAVMPYELGQWPAGRAHTGLRCAALYLAWRTDSQRHLVAAKPGRWPQIPTQAWDKATKALRTAATPADRVEYVAWRLGTALTAVEWTVTTAYAAEIAAALALYVAWRDELALAVRRRRLAEHDAHIDAEHAAVSSRQAA